MWKFCQQQRNSGTGALGSQYLGYKFQKKKTNKSKQPNNAKNDDPKPYHNASNTFDTDSVHEGECVLSFTRCAIRYTYKWILNILAAVVSGSCENLVKPIFAHDTGVLIRSREADPAKIRKVSKLAIKNSNTFLIYAVMDVQFDGNVTISILFYFRGTLSQPILLYSHWMHVKRMHLFPKRWDIYFYGTW